MKPLLETLAIHLVKTASDKLGDTRIILPNRRAGLFLQRHLSRHISNTGWAPRIYSISDFIDETSSLERSDPLDLFFTLYDIYSGFAEQPDSLDEFYLWGEMMLRDFDELDKYLVDADMLFRNMVDLKALEEPLAGLEPEQLEFIRQFWTGFHWGGQTPEKEQFIRSWVLLPELYKRLRSVLTARGEGYQGMQYRQIAERIAGGEMEFGWEGPTVIAGFNALNQCEKRIFSWMQKHGAEFFWDYDHLYTDTAGKEAGRFLRDNMEHFPASESLEDFRGLEKDKEIRIFELPTDVLQAKTLHRILESKGPDTRHDCTDTAVILCDEELLLPVMMSLPEGSGEINVTMGYPMKNTPVYSFIDQLLRMQHNTRKASGGKVRFYHRDVMAVLLHPYYRKMKPDSTEDLSLHMVRNNLILVDQEVFSGELEKVIFKQVGGSAGLIRYLRTLFNHILEALSGREETMQDALDRAFIFQLLTYLNKFEGMITRRPGISEMIFERLLKKSLGALRIPFEGEPLSGLQLMGILETRLLDFRHVILLSMNEELMPAAHETNSNIPYSLRLAFRMPAREDMDAIYAYYFYRLLQRAERVDLLFNGGTEGIRTGEMSRYLHQLVFNRKLEIIRPGLEVKARKIPDLEIPHTRMADIKLERYLKDGEEGRFLSPSAVNTYMDCSLKFYLRYIAGIGEADEISEELDPAGFGTVVHDTLKELYREIADLGGAQLTRNGLTGLLESDRPGKVLLRVFRDHHYKGRRQEVLEGRNIIIFRVMLRYLEKIIRTDLAIAPFELVSAEMNYQRKLNIKVKQDHLEVRLGGKIDRIDRVNGLLRVIDYKTGQSSQKFSTLESLFDRDHVSRNSAAMQTLFYAWLVGEVYAEEKVMPGLYAMKELFEEHFDPALIMTSLKKEGRIESFEVLEEPFLRLLKEVLQRLFDPDVPYVQRNNDKKCSYCDFASLCQRQIIE
ncbi:MAG: PD-(D/E)XK nuclease family protein [Bacteroidales bacterium]|nr:PD-(D/E)XK nuclease family protein [Bacteroidales bacterium]